MALPIIAPCGDAAENARSDGAADTVCISRCWSDANARCADQRDERFVHVFSLVRPSPIGTGLSGDASNDKTTNPAPKGLLNRLSPGRNLG